MSSAQEPAAPASNAPARMPSQTLDQSAGNPASAVGRGAAYGRWGFDDSGVDLKANPGDSFYDFASGLWDARAVIPADKFRFGVFDALGEKTQEQVRAIVEEAAKSPSPGTDGGKIGALYTAFMDEARIERLDAAPIADDLAKIRDAKTKADIAALMGRARGGFGSSLFFVTVSEDAKDRPATRCKRLRQDWAFRIAIIICGTLSRTRRPSIATTLRACSAWSAGQRRSSAPTTSSRSRPGSRKRAGAEPRAATATRPIIR
jgi:hypothetical protein